MAFVNERFPDAISFGAIGGLAWNTDIAQANSGIEARNQVWSLPLGKWEVGHNARTADVYKPLRAHFNVMAGRANSFPFKDWTDFTVGASEGVFVMLTATTFQCYKRYTAGSHTFDRKIWLPRSAISVTGGSVASVSYTTGIVTMTSGTPTAWTGEFDCLARYDIDQMRAETISRSGSGLVVGWAGIPLVELRQP